MKQNKDSRVNNLYIPQDKRHYLLDESPWHFWTEMIVLALGLFSIFVLCRLGAWIIADILRL